MRSIKRPWIAVAEGRTSHEETMGGSSGEGNKAAAAPGLRFVYTKRPFAGYSAAFR